MCICVGKRVLLVLGAERYTNGGMSRTEFEGQDYKNSDVGFTGDEYLDYLDVRTDFKILNWTMMAVIFFVLWIAMLVILVRKNGL